MYTMPFLVSRLMNGRRFELATFLRRYEAERYAEQQSGLSGYVYQVEDLAEDLHSVNRYLAVYSADGERLPDSVLEFWGKADGNRPEDVNA
jgi:hypothetical protein